MNSRSTGTGCLLVAVSLAAATPVAVAQEYPSKNIRLIVPYAPGGKSDLFGRLVGQKLAATFGHQVIIDTRPGANGNLGTDLVAKSAPDGYTLLVGAPGPITISVSLYDKLPYDPLKDLAPITMAASTPNLLVVHPSLPVNSVKELIRYAKSNPGKLNYGSGGYGSSAHMAAELFNSMAGIRMQHIPYKGAQPALMDVIAGEVSLVFTNMPAAFPHMRTGRLKALAVTTSSRSRAAPELPSVADTLPGYDANNWTGFFAPAGTPRSIILRLQSEIVRVLQAPEVEQMLAADGAEVVGSSPEEFAKLIAAEIVTWRKVINESGVRANY